jgi:hypothetical protein
MALGFVLRLATFRSIVIPIKAIVLTLTSMEYHVFILSRIGRPTTAA